MLLNEKNTKSSPYPKNQIPKSWWEWYHFLIPYSSLENSHFRAKKHDHKFFEEFKFCFGILQPLVLPP